MTPPKPPPTIPAPLDDRQRLHRRILLGLASQEAFGLFADITEAVSLGQRVQEDFGFTPDEIDTARMDRAFVRVRYEAGKSNGESFTTAALKAKLAFLESIGVVASVPPEK